VVDPLPESDSARVLLWSAYGYDCGNELLGHIWWLTYRPGYVEHSWPSILLALALFGAATGGIPGAVVGAGKMFRGEAGRVSAAETQ
jgi:hypothetical protein